MAPPLKFKQEKVIEALQASMGMVAPAARKLGCEPNTIRNYAKRFPRVQAAMDDQREQFLDESEIQLMGAVRRSEAWAIAFALKTIGRSRGYVDRTEKQLELGKNGDEKWIFMLTPGDGNSAKD